MGTTQVKKSPLKSQNMWVGIATIIAAAFAYFGVSGDAATANELADTATDVANAIDEKNWGLLFGVGINAVNIITHLWKTYFAK